jgi:hypothetical protein
MPPTSARHELNMPSHDQIESAFQPRIVRDARLSLSACQ